MEDKLEQLRDEAVAAFQNAEDEEQLEQARVQYLGRQGRLREMMKNLGSTKPAGLGGRRALVRNLTRARQTRAGGKDTGVPTMRQDCRWPVVTPRLQHFYT